MERDLTVFKFGGASVSSAEAVRNVARIVRDQASGPAVIVVSAMGKMTNALEGVVKAYVEGHGDADSLFNQVKQYHWDVASELFDSAHPIFALINDMFVEIEWVLEDEIHDSYNYLYDQIVGTGELISTRIVQAYFSSENIASEWLDARDMIKTDENYRSARINWVKTTSAVHSAIRPILKAGRHVVTQGFIGSTDDNNTTTLGREGSDYTAAIIANVLDAREVIVWKDVPGIQTADPAIFQNTTRLDRLTYREAVEMTYYGAKVIHPKTIKPLQNKQIPLFVRSFDNPGDPGTLIGTDIDPVLPPIIVMADKQALINISVRDYSFVAEHHLSNLFKAFAEVQLKINLMRNSAISFLVCCEDHLEKIERFRAMAGDDFTIVVDHGLKLFTIRHATPEAVNALISGHSVVFSESFEKTEQYVVKEAPVVKPKQERT